MRYVIALDAALRLFRERARPAEGTKLVAPTLLRSQAVAQLYATARRGEIDRTWVAAVADGKADGETLAIGGPEPLTGDALAEQIGAGLGRDLSYQPIPPSGFAQGMNAAMGAPAWDRLASIYAWLEDHPIFMRTDTALAARFDVPIESARDFAARILG